MAGNSNRNIAEGGGGPGEEYDSGHAPLIALGIVAAALLAGLYWEWPRCEEDACLPIQTAQQESGHKGASGSAGADNAAPAPPGSSPDAGAAPVSTPPLEVKAISPTRGSMCGGSAVAISGAGFSQDDLEVRFGGLQARSLELHPDRATLLATTPEHWEGAVDVTIRAGGNSVVLAKGFRFECPDRTQARLLLLVILAGALGGTVHGLRSLVYFVGNRMLRRSWLSMYFVLPLTSAAISTLFFLVFAAGLFSPQGDDGQNFFVMVGVSAIVGMFSPQAVEKLKKISEAILTTAPPAADAAPEEPEIEIASLKPATGDSAGGTDVVITGAGFVTGATVSFGGAPATSLSVLDTSIELKTPPHAVGKVTVEVANPDGTTATKPDAFEYT